jgi:hypothetical protein
MIIPCTRNAKRGAASISPVLMQSGPSRPHARSKLMTLPSSVDGVVYRCLHILPTVTCLAWLP